MVFVMPEQAVPAAQYRVPEPPPIEQRLPKGNLVLEVQPGSAQVFVDGYFAGAADDFNGGRRSLPLDAGPHTIVLDEPGYELVNFDVKIASSDAVVYRRVLNRASIPPPAPSPSIVTPPAPIYLIPGCYVGNVPPKDAGLPPTCDPARAVRLN